ncbi:DUF302 domain-containing protein [Sphingomicrobium sediminis]|uniref:DUF302 domain-containing protein n=1 Tax=Sphingomicrobium sediminis TaxID=2950949 RepID=A0A9X2EHW9_9SPHN|nr:DUF302 domain-containing protein [Sphingomicrobium sediminis]MCM8557041.1 DUF302 domain-containing protein [Sphingomicrobium sediminis]
MRFILPTIASFALLACSGGEEAVAPEETADVEVVESEGGEVASFGNGVQTLVSDAGVEETAERLEATLEANGFTIVAKLNHAENAATVELNMSPAISIFFGKPEVGTHLMKSAPSAALDLPQRMAIYETVEGEVAIAYNSPVWLASRHGIEGEDARLDAVADALEMLATTAAGQLPEPPEADNKEE